MNAWGVVVAREAASALRRLDRTQRARLEAAIDQLALDPAPGPGRDIRPLQGTHGLWRLRVGDWRVIFRLDAERHVIQIASIRARGQAYNRL